MISAAPNSRTGGNLNNEDILVAAVKGENEKVRVLLNEGADINVVDGEGFSLLHIACLSGNDGLVDIILRHSETVSKCDYDARERSSNMLAWQLAARYGHFELAERVQLVASSAAKIVAFPSRDI